MEEGGGVESVNKNDSIAQCPEESSGLQGTPGSAPSPEPWEDVCISCGSALITRLRTTLEPLSLTSTWLIIGHRLQSEGYEGKYFPKS